MPFVDYKIFCKLISNTKPFLKGFFYAKNK
jgi:hypothetical protein